MEVGSPRLGHAEYGMTGTPPERFSVPSHPHNPAATVRSGPFWILPVEVFGTSPKTT